MKVNDEKREKADAKTEDAHAVTRAGAGKLAGGERYIQRDGSGEPHVIEESRKQAKD